MPMLGRDSVWVAALTLGVCAVGFFPAVARAQSWLSAGVEAGQRIALEDSASDGEVSIALATPLRRSVRHPSYTMWFYRYDCTTGIRYSRASVIYSASRDPVRTEFDESTVISSRNSIIDQFETVCSRDNRRSGTQYRTIGDFVDDRPLASSGPTR